MQVFIGIILGFIIAIIVMIVTGFGQDYELITTIDDLQKELKDNKDKLKNKEIAEIRTTFFARKIKEIKDHFAKKIKELNLVWNKDKQQYEIVQEE